MALIVFHGPRCIDAALAFKREMGWPAWDLSPDIPEACRVDALSCQTPSEAIAFVDKCAHDPDLDWITPDGWTPREMSPVEGFDGIPGIPL